MSSYNYTYNYNQKEPSFWQSLGMGMLYQGMGSFGSLTGCGMGMGSYGMGSCMGMGGSLFSMSSYGMGNMYADPSTFFGMGGYGCGSYGMSGMYGIGGYGCCGMSDAQFGAQLGLMGVGIAFKGLMGSISERKAAKAAASAELDAALKTLGLNIDNVNEKFDSNKQFDGTKFDGAIKTAASKAIDALKYDANMPMPSDADIKPIYDTDGKTIKEYTYTYNGKTTKGTETDCKAQYNIDKDAYDNNKEKKVKYDELNKIMNNPENYDDSSLLDSDIVGADVFAKVKAKETAKDEFDKAIVTVKNYIIQNEGKSNIKALKAEMTQVDKSNKDTVQQQTNLRKAENSYIKELKQYRSKGNNKSELISAYKALADGKFKDDAKTVLLKFGIPSNILEG